MRETILSKLTQDELAALRFDWFFWSRANQRTPGSTGAEISRADWQYWLILAGRGFGKTRTGAETVRRWSREFTYCNLIAATADDARDIMVEGESGIIAICPRAERPHYEPSKRKLTWPNGSVSLIFTADEPERLRGKQHMKLWCDEIAAWRYPESWDQAKFGLRIGTNPQAVVTTTPRPTQLVRDITADPGTVVTRGSTYANRENLAPAFFATVIKKYEGTRLGRQELDGEVLDDNPNALFQRGDIDAGRIAIDAMPITSMDRIVVAIDPAATNNEESDETGIVVAGMKGDHAYIFADVSGKFSPRGWAQKAVAHFHEKQADRIVAEVNNGGDMVVATIHAEDPNVPVTKVTATRGKAIRAEPVAALYEQHRVHHVGSFTALEDQMCEFDPIDTSNSPDRMDAMVWAIHDLMLGERSTGALELMRDMKASQSKPAPRAPHWSEGTT